MALTTEEVRAEADRVLRDHLLGSQLYDALTLDQFKNLFPQKYRSSPLIDDIYDLLLKRRDDVRQVVEANIQGFVDNINLPRQVPKLSLQDAINLLKAIDEKHQLELAHERKRLAEVQQRVTEEVEWLDSAQAEELQRLSSKLDLNTARTVHEQLVDMISDDAR